MLDNMIGDHFIQHIGQDAEQQFSVINGQQQPAVQLRTRPAAYAGRDFIVASFNAKDYLERWGKDVKAGECVLLRVFGGCTHLRELHFRGSKGGECAHYLNIKDGVQTCDADGLEIPINKCYLDVGEKSEAWPETDLFLVDLDCPIIDSKTGSIAGIPLALGAEGIETHDSIATRLMHSTDAHKYGIIAIPKADVPPLASLFIELNIGNSMAL